MKHNTSTGTGTSTGITKPIYLDHNNIGLEFREYNHDVCQSVYFASQCSLLPG